MTGSGTMHKQRIVLVVAAAAGILSAVMPWQNIAQYISQSGLDLGQAWIVFAIFGAALGVSLLGSWAAPPSGIWRAAGGLLGAGGIAVGIWKYLQVKDGALGVGELGELGGLGGLGGMEKSQPMMNEVLKAMVEPGMGLYAMIAAGAVFAIASLYRARRSTLLPRGPYAD
jgi:hypothetical protein